MLSSEQSYKRKIQEAYLAMQLETEYTKAANSGMLSERPCTWAKTTTACKMAAQGYFGKELSELTLRECAMLAGLTNNPYYYNPRRNFYTRHLRYDGLRRP